MSPRSLEHMKTMAGISHLVDDNNSPKGDEANLPSELNKLRIADKSYNNNALEK